MPVRRWNVEQIVNTTKAGGQLDPYTVALPDGGYLTVWQTGGYAGDTSIAAQRFDAFGKKVGAEYLLETGDTGLERDPSAAVMSNGSIIYTWSDQYLTSATDVDVQGVIIAPNGTRTTLNLVNSSSDEREGRVVVDGTGFAVVYTNYTNNAGDIILRRFDQSGQLIQTINVNAATTGGDQFNPEIARLAGGNTAIVWMGGSTELRYRVFNANGAAVGGEITISILPNVGVPTITALADGGFVVSWAVDMPNTTWDVRARVYDASGNPISSEFAVNQLRGGIEYSSSIAALQDGGFLAVWSNGTEIRSQLFDAFGGRQGQEQMLAASVTGGGQENGAVVDAKTLADGRVVITWTDNGGDGDGLGIRSIIVDPRDGIVNGNSGDNLLLGSDQLSDDMAGFRGNDDIRGLKGDDMLSGGAGHDTLDGGLGADTMIGGIGYDTFIVDNVGDTVIEFDETGVDVVKSSVTFTLGDFVENLTLTGTQLINGTGNQLSNYLTGNEVANKLEGLGGADTLDGGLGADKLYGGLGDDTYIVDNIADKVFEVINEGTADTVWASVNFALVGQVENLTLTGTDTIQGTGSALNNVMIGNVANNVLTTGGGRDMIVFNNPIGPNNVDTITDFNVQLDTIQLNRFVFTAFAAAGAIAQSQFQNLSLGAADGLDRIIYDKVNGDLYYDADGSGVGFTAIKFADIQNNAVLTYLDFLIA